MIYICILYINSYTFSETHWYLSIILSHVQLDMPAIFQASPKSRPPCDLIWGTERRILEVWSWWQLAAQDSSGPKWSQKVPRKMCFVGSCFVASLLPPIPDFPIEIKGWTLAPLIAVGLNICSMVPGTSKKIWAPEIFSCPPSPTTQNMFFFCLKIA